MQANIVLRKPKDKAMTTGSQDPALFEDSPAVRAAVLEERRFSTLEGMLGTLIKSVDSLNSKVEVANGRTTKNEIEIGLLRNEIKNKRLWERLDIFDVWKAARDNEDAHDDGVHEGAVSLRTSDKFWFGLFITTGLSVLGLVIKFL